jgi:hypothetical protein
MPQNATDDPRTESRNYLKETTRQEKTCGSGEPHVLEN